MKRPHFRILASTIFLLAIPGAGMTLPWDKDMRDQPSFKPQDSLVSISPSSVPVGGKDRFSPRKTSLSWCRHGWRLGEPWLTR